MLYEIKVKPALSYCCSWLTRIFKKEIKKIAAQNAKAGMDCPDTKKSKPSSKNVHA